MKNSKLVEITMEKLSNIDYTGQLTLHFYHGEVNIATLNEAVIIADEEQRLDIVPATGYTKKKLDRE